MPNKEQKCCLKCDISVTSGRRYGGCDNHNCECHSLSPKEEEWMTEFEEFSQRYELQELLGGKRMLMLRGLIRTFLSHQRASLLEKVKGEIERRINSAGGIGGLNHLREIIDASFTSLESEANQE